MCSCLRSVRGFDVITLLSTSEASEKIEISVDRERSEANLSNFDNVSISKSPPSL
jgi:hypothetical protein